MRTLALVIGTIAFIQPAFAEECGLKSYGTFDVGGGAPYITATVKGEPVRFAISLSSPYTGISEAVADKIHAIKEPGDMFGISFGTVNVTHVAKVPLQIGALRASSFPVFIIPSEVGGDPDEGILGMDVLNRVDVELDLGHGKINLFSREHCRGKVVYWSNTFAAIPLTIDRSYVNWFGMRLDAKDVRVSIAAGNPRSTIPLSLVRSTFGIDRTAPGMTPLPQEGDSEFQFLQYPFSSLSSSTLAINNPVIDIMDDSALRCRGNSYAFYWEDRCVDNNMSFLRLGRNVLGKLRIYLAFGEKMAYLTAADAH